MKTHELRIHSTAGNHQFAIIDNDDGSGMDFGLIYNRGNDTIDNAQELVRRWNMHSLHPLGSRVLVLDDDVMQWKPGYVTARDVLETEGDNPVITWTVYAPDVRGGKWVSSNEDQISAFR